MATITPCAKHNRPSCTDLICQNDNAGKLGLATNGDLTIGVGGGVGIDLSTGGLTVGGFPL